VNAAAGRWRRWAVKLVRHAVCVLPHAQSAWADAMRRELDYIGDDPAALRWALGCVLASYKARMAHRPSFRAPAAWRQIATCGALMIMIGFALQDHAGGQTEPPPPAVETNCERPDASSQTAPNRTIDTSRNDHSTGRVRPRLDCPDPSSANTFDIPRGR